MGNSMRSINMNFLLPHSEYVKRRYASLHIPTRQKSLIAAAQLKGLERQASFIDDLKQFNLGSWWDKKYKELSEKKKRWLENVAFEGIEFIETIKKPFVTTLIKVISSFMTGPALNWVWKAVYEATATRLFPLCQDSFRAGAVYRIEMGTTIRVNPSELRSKKIAYDYWKMGWDDADKVLSKGHPMKSSQYDKLSKRQTREIESRLMGEIKDLFLVHFVNNVKYNIIDNPLGVWKMVKHNWLKEKAKGGGFFSKVWGVLPGIIFGLFKIIAWFIFSKVLAATGGVLGLIVLIGKTVTSFLIPTILHYITDAWSKFRYGEAVSEEIKKEKFDSDTKMKLQKKIEEKALEERGQFFDKVKSKAIDFWSGEEVDPNAPLED
jgi:hypothetical protein